MTARAKAPPASESSAGWFKNIVRMHPDKRSVRRKLLHAQRSDDFLLELLRIVRSQE